MESKPHAETQAAPADVDASAKKRKRDDLEKSDSKLSEYLRTFQPGKSTANEVSEMMDPAAAAEQEKLLQDAESDEEYEKIPARPEKKQMKEAPATEPETNRVSFPSSTGKMAGEQEDLDADPGHEPEPPTETKPDALATDDDWLRSRTNRLLDLVDIDELPQRHLPPQQNDDQVTGHTDGENREVRTGDGRPQDTESKAEKSPGSPELIKEAQEPDEEPAVAAIRKTSRLFVRNLPFATSEEDLRTHFEQFGEVQEVSVRNGCLSCPCFTLADHMMNPDRDS